jgi:hypothetical protein
MHLRGYATTLDYFELYLVYFCFCTAVNFLLNLCSVSSLAWFMSNQETSFVTIGQRVLANPLRYSSEINCTFTV